MKVLFLSRYGCLGASSRLRTYQYLPYLSAEGIYATVVPLLDDKYLVDLYSGRKVQYRNIVKFYLRRLSRLFDSKTYDLIWLEKELFPWLPAFGEVLLQYFGVPYIVDYDDAAFHRYDRHRNPLVRALIGRKIDGVMREASMVIVGNDYLADRARLAGAKRVEYLPTVINLDRYVYGQPQVNDGFTIGWIGTPVTSKYLKVVASAVAEVAQKRQIRIVAVGPCMLTLGGVPVETRHWSEDTEVEQIRAFDVGIMPLPNDAWERGKCGYKLIQYMACGVPVIASPVGVNRKIVEQGDNGFLASTHADWVNAFITLMDDRELRRQMGEAGRAKVEKEYCLQVTAPRLVELMYQVTRRNV